MPSSYGAIPTCLEKNICHNGAHYIGAGQDRYTALPMSEEAPRPTPNRLGQETSAYLRQHMHNPYPTDCEKIGIMNATGTTPPPRLHLAARVHWSVLGAS